jgi:hypothetical protein
MDASRMMAAPYSALLLSFAAVLSQAVDIAKMSGLVVFDITSDLTRSPD